MTDINTIREHKDALVRLTLDNLELAMKAVREGNVPDMVTFAQLASDFAQRVPVEFAQPELFTQDPDLWRGYDERKRQQRTEEAKAYRAQIAASKKEAA